MELQPILLFFILKGLFTVLASVNSFFTVSKLKSVWKLLFDGSNAARILTLDDTVNLFRQI